MKTIITKITVIGRTVWTEYNRNGVAYEGFNSYDTFEQAKAEAEKLLNIFNADFISGTDKIVYC